MSAIYIAVLLLGQQTIELRPAPPAGVRANERLWTDWVEHSLKPRKPANAAPAPKLTAKEQQQLLIKQKAARAAAQRQARLRR